MAYPPLIAEHDTWISLDPLLGCPSRCAYCYLGPLQLVGKRPTGRVSPQELVLRLEERLASRRARSPSRDEDATPVCLGNHTDMLMTPEGLAFLTEYLPLHAAAFPRIPVCVVTKARLGEAEVQRLDTLGVNLLVFLSQSFISEARLGPLEQGPTARPRETFRAAELLSRSRHLLPIHFWRPLTERTVPTGDAALDQLRRMRDAGALASVAIGLQWGPGVRAQAPALRALVDGVEALPPGEHLPATVWARARAAAEALNHPLFRNTSCAIALARRRHEHLGSWRPGARHARCAPALCPLAQRARCEARLREDRPLSAETMTRLARALALEPDAVRWDEASGSVRVDATLTQERHAELNHQLERLVSPRAVELTRAWGGAILPPSAQQLELESKGES